MGITPDGTPFPTPDPFERPTPAPDREDGNDETNLYTTIDEKEAQDAALRKLEASRTHRRILEEDLLPKEQAREDELTRAREEAGRRKEDFERRKKLKDGRIATWQHLALPLGEKFNQFERWVVLAVLGVEFPLALVAGYALIGGIKTHVAFMDGPLKIAPLGFALGIATICCLSTISAGRLLGGYFEQQRVSKVAAELASDEAANTKNNTDIEEGRAA